MLPDAVEPVSPMPGVAPLAVPSPGVEPLVLVSPGVVTVPDAVLPLVAVSPGVVAVPDAVPLVAVSLGVVAVPAAEADASASVWGGVDGAVACSWLVLDGSAVAVWPSLDWVLLVLHAEIPRTSGSASAMARTYMGLIPPRSMKVCAHAPWGEPPRREGRASGRADGYAPSPMALRLSLSLVLVLVLAAGCRGEPGPADRYRTFAAAARRGDGDAVWSMLSEGSRAALDARAKALAARVPAGVVPGSGRELVLGGLSARAPRPGQVLVVRESRDTAVVAVEVEGEPPREVMLVREGGVWRVVVPFDN
jgi:hypothetical protein